MSFPVVDAVATKVYSAQRSPEHVTSAIYPRVMKEYLKPWESTTDGLSQFAGVSLRQPRKTTIVLRAVTLNEHEKESAEQGIVVLAVGA